VLILPAKEAMFAPARRKRRQRRRQLAVLTLERGECSAAIAAVLRVDVERPPSSHRAGRHPDHRGWPPMPKFLDHLLIDGCVFEALQGERLLGFRRARKYGDAVAGIG
jgi:hypothetical protein